MSFRLRRIGCVLVLCFAHVGSLYAQEYVSVQSFAHSPDKLFQAAQRVFDETKVRVIESNTAHYTIRVRLDRNRSGGPFGSLRADYAVFTATPDPLHHARTLAVIRLGHPDISSSGSRFMGMNWTYPGDKPFAKKFFRKLTKHLGP